MTAPARYRRQLPDDAVLSHWTAPDGWGLRRFDWPAPAGRGSILFQGGRGDVIEKYLETFAHFHARGWSVTSFDWRGQGGSGRLSSDQHVGHAVSFLPYLADLSAVWRDIGRQDGVRVAIGHSMGGHLLLRALLDGSVDPDAAVLVAPMLGLRSPVGARWGGRLARFIANRGDPARAAWRGNERPASLVTRQRLLTNDRDRYADEAWWYEQCPQIRLGPPSWSWLAEAFASVAGLEADARLDTLPTPVLTLLADHDRLVDSRAAARIVARLPHGAALSFGKESAHEILRETDPVRDRALAAIDAFLDRHAPA